MLDAFIIDKLKRRQREEEAHRRPTLELPLYEDDGRPRPDEDDETDESERGPIDIEVDFRIR